MGVSLETSILYSHAMNPKCPFHRILFIYFELITLFSFCGITLIMYSSPFS